MNFKFLPITSSILLLSALSNVAMASGKSFPVVEIMGQKYYMYVSKKGDTLYGIARQNQWDDETLQKLNANVMSPMKKGVKIYYPVKSGETSGPITDFSSQPVTELTHIVGKGESVYSIAALYGMNVDEIYRLNPTAKNGIKTGQSLALRNEEPFLDSKELPSAGERYCSLGHTDNLKDIADTYNTSVAAILAENPGISPGNIKTGTVIKIPESGSGIVEVKQIVETPVVEVFDTYIVQGKDTWESIADKTGVDSQLLTEANPDVKNLKKKQVLTVPKVVTVTEEKMVTQRDDREQSKDGIYSIYKDVHKVADRQTDMVTVKAAIVAEAPNSKKDAEFIRGFLTGIEKIKKDGYRVSLKVIDGSKTSASVTDALNSFEPNIVFYTGDKNLPEYIRNYASESLTPVVNTFDVRSEDYLNNPYIIQLLAPSAYFNENVATNAYDKFKDRRLIILGEEDTSDQLAPELKKLWDSKRIQYVPQGSLNDALLSEDERYVIYSYTVKKAEIEKMLSELSELKESSPLTDVVVLGRPNWIMFDESLAQAFHKANTYIPSRFYIDESSSQAKAFNTSYKSLFNRAPAKSLPLYAAVGYDTSSYFIPALGHASNDLNQIKPSRNTVQSEFDLKRLSSWSGFINPPVYFVNFTPYDFIDKIVIE